jgi:nitrite reductase/ring-hydroxylating ferredoxin subunit
MAAPMAWKTDAYLNAAGDRIVCASHGAEFDTETGVCLHGAALVQKRVPAPFEVTSDEEILFTGSV